MLHTCDRNGIAYIVQKAVKFVRIEWYGQWKTLTIVINRGRRAVSCMCGGWKGTSLYKAVSAKPEFLIIFSVFRATDSLVTMMIRTSYQIGNTHSIHVFNFQF